ncbi:DUF2267 domain-containing protein [Candidatus Parcubacteria bacterium]|nr:MAG: DUF2267 domain-containing protein [Candidatus Parcubacteria bacterium]
MPKTTLDTFDASIQKTNIMLKAVEDRFGWHDRNKAYLALRAVLTTLRDRLTPEHALGLGAQLPMIVRGFYYEGWRPQQTPLKMNKDEFVGEVERQINPMTYDMETEEMIKGVVAIVQDYTDPNEMRKIKKTLPEGIQNMLVPA